MAHTNPGANCEDAISPGLSPAAAAMAAKLALVGNCAAPCSAADSPGDATITWPVPKVVAKDEGAWVTMVCACMPALLSVVVAWLVVGDTLKDGELVAVVITGAVEMTDAVFVPCGRDRWIFKIIFYIWVYTHAQWKPHTPVKDKLGMLVLVRGITGFTVRVVGVVIVGLLSRLAVLATCAKEEGRLKN